jgi:hypothetical protein
LAINIRKKAYGVLDIIFFLENLWKKEESFFMLSRFKYLQLRFSFIGLEQGHFQKYDRKTLYPMLLKCYHHLHPLSKNVIVDQGVDEDCNKLDIF